MTKFEDCASAMMKADWEDTGREVPPDAKISNYYAMLRAVIRCLMEVDRNMMNPIWPVTAPFLSDNQIKSAVRAMLESVLDEGTTSAPS